MSSVLLASNLHASRSASTHRPMNFIYVWVVTCKDISNAYAVCSTCDTNLIGMVQYQRSVLLLFVQAYWAVRFDRFANSIKLDMHQG